MHTLDTPITLTVSLYMLALTINGIGQRVCDVGPMGTRGLGIETV